MIDHHPSVDLGGASSRMDEIRMPDTDAPSTTWEWRRCKVTPAPEAKERAERSESPSGSLLPWPRSKPLTVVLKYRGGPEGWVEVRARGRVWRRPGTMALYDVLTMVFGWAPK